MKVNFKMFLTLLLALVVQVSFAQEKTVTGTVVDEEGLPIPGVNVIIKDTTTGTQTDFDGNFSIEAEIGQTLMFTYLGLKTQEIVVSTQNNLSIVMTTDASQLDEVFVVAYGTSTIESFTGSATVIGQKDLEMRSVTSPISAIEGKAAGVQFTSASGQPGSSPGIVIRGVGTLTGNSAPLIIVDGMQYEGSINTINQEDIESFTILKDAASTSLYGSRAANGVILITTKSGKKGVIQATFSSQFGVVDQSIDNYDAVSPGQYYEIMWEALKNSSAGGGDPAFASANIFNSLGYNPFNVPNDQIVGQDGRLNPNARVIYQSLDWYDVLQQTGFRENYNLNVSGGGENSKFFFSTSYLEEEGYVVTSNFDRLTTRLNGEFNITDKFIVGGSANITITEQAGPFSAGTGSIVNPFGFAKNIGSIYPVFVNDLDGNLVRDAAGNPVFDSGEGFPEFNIGSRPISQGRHALQELLLNDERNQDNTYGFRYFGEYELIDGLKVRLNYGRDINELFNKEFENQIIGDAQPTGRFSERRSRREVENFNQIITYSKTINDDHNIDITAGHETFERTFSTNRGLAIDLVAEGIFEFDNFSTPVSLSGSSTVKTIEGYFVRANYNYDDKYYISGSYRRDGSSVFGSDNRWGNFFSVGGSWRMDQEDFIKNLSFVDKLKLRGSYGEVGNDDLGDFFLSQPRFTLTSNAGNPAIVWSDIGNSNLQWETIESWDVALEFALFDNFLEGSVEFYRRNSTELLFDLPIALSNGLDSFPANIADMFNSGWEFSLTGNLINNSDFNWDVTLLASTFKNEITDIPDPFVNGSKRWDVGRSRFDFYILQTAGVDPATGDQLFLKFEFDDDGNSVPVLDANGVQEVTNDWQDTERAYTGDSSIPDVLGSINNSFSYKGFNLNVLITYGIGGKILDNGYSAMMHSGDFGRSLHPDILNAWRQPGDITDVPRMESGSNDLVRTQSSRFLTDADFWSLKNVSLRYNFDRSIAEKVGVSDLSLSFTGENLYIDSERDGLDPQFNLAGTPAGNDFNPSRIFSLGLNVTF